MRWLALCKPGPVRAGGVCLRAPVLLDVEAGLYMCGCGARRVRGRCGFGPGPRSGSARVREHVTQPASTYLWQTCSRVK